MLLDFKEWLGDQFLIELEVIAETEEAQQVSGQILSAFENKLPNIHQQAQAKLTQVANQLKQFPEQTEQILQQAKQEQESQIKKVIAQLKSSSSAIGGTAAQGAEWIVSKLSSMAFSAIKSITNWFYRLIKTSAKETIMPTGWTLLGHVSSLTLINSIASIILILSGSGFPMIGGFLAAIGFKFLNNLVMHALSPQLISA